MSRPLRIALILLLVAVAIEAINFRSLYHRVLRLARPERTEEQARREVVQPPITTPTDVKVKAKIFWASAIAPGTLEPVEVELPLSANPIERAKQVLGALIANPPTPEQRTVPTDVTLAEFYLLADGTAVADFSDTFVTATPSGILSEQMAVDSIARTLEANLDSIQRLKILIHGQETETLAGHVDLTGFFPLHSQAPAPQKPAASGLTASTTPGKLGH